MYGSRYITVTPDAPTPLGCRSMGASIPRSNTLASGTQVHQEKAPLSTHTKAIKIPLHNSYKKLHLDGRLALTLYARDKGLV